MLYTLTLSKAMKIVIIECYLYKERCHPLRCVIISRYSVYHLNRIDQQGDEINHSNLKERLHKDVKTMSVS